MWGDATNWDEATYRESILKDREIQTRTVFRTVWPPFLNPNPNPNSIVVASSDGSLASYPISSIVSELPLGFGSVKDSSQHFMAEPDFILHAHDGPVYDTKFYGDGEDALLLSCGDDGWIRGWRWMDITESKVPFTFQGKHVKPILELVNSQHRMSHAVFLEVKWDITVVSLKIHGIIGPWGALSPIPENNAIAVNAFSGSIYAAAGDSCAYCWDMECGQIKMVFKGHSDYLHSIIARNSSDQIITGSEDGTARIWDCRSGKCTKTIEPAKEMKLKGSSSYVGCIGLDASERWLVCGSGRSISVWNLPASECVYNISTPASIQDLLFDENHVLAVGAEPFLYRFDLNGTIHSQIQCAPQSAFSVALHSSGVAAIGGYGGLVDVISQFGSHLCTFRCYFD